jgi:glucokinase
MDCLVLGIEIGGTKQQIAIGDRNGKLLRVVTGKIPIVDGADGILAWLKQNIQKLLEDEPDLANRIAGIGVGFGGPLESATGRVLTSVQVKGWKDFMLKKWFEENFKLPTVVVNDTVAGGFGEYCFGWGKGSKHFFYTNIGSGIGGIFILNGKYYDGQGYGAAYFGNTYVPDWYTDKPGAECKLEQLCSGWSIEKRLRIKGYIPKDSLILNLSNFKVETISCLMLQEAAYENDSFALAETDRIAKSFSIGLANVITLVSPECIVIGGGVAKMGKPLLEPIRRYTDELVFISSKGRYSIHPSTFGDTAVLIGAVVFATRTLPNIPQTGV